MINYRSLPIFEVRNFLVNKQTGLTIKRYFDQTIRSSENNLIANEYCEALMELERRLSSKLTVSDQTLKRLFGPLRNSMQGEITHLFLSACDMLVRRLKEYTNPSVKDFFETVRSQSGLVATNIAERLLDNKFPKGEIIDAETAMRMISQLDLSIEDRVGMYEILINTDRYIDELEEIMTPLVEEFNRSEHLLKPLNELYRNDYSGMDATNAYIDMYQDKKNIPKVIEVYPSYISCQHTTISFVDGGFDEVVIFMGTLRKFDEKNMILGDAENGKLYSMMNSLGNQSRFLIVNRLSKGPAYGRELSKLLGLSPGTISQHLSVLAGFGLINVASDGNRLYYSLNREQFKVFLELQKELFIDTDTKYPQ